MEKTKFTKKALFQCSVQILRECPAIKTGCFQINVGINLTLYHNKNNEQHRCGILTRFILTMLLFTLDSGITLAKAAFYVVAQHAR